MILAARFQVHAAAIALTVDRPFAYLPFPDGLRRFAAKPSGTKKKMWHQQMLDAHTVQTSANLWQTYEHQLKTPTRRY